VHESADVVLVICDLCHLMGIDMVVQATLVITAVMDRVDRGAWPKPSDPIRTGAAERKGEDR